MQSGPLPDLNNTRIAFSRFSSAELRDSYFLFRLLGIPWMVEWGSRLAQWAIRIGLPVQWAIRKTVFHQFCGGETIVGCEPAVAQLAMGGVGTILDYSVEGTDGDEAFDACAEEIIRTIHKARGDDRIPFAVFKVSGVASVELMERISAQSQPAKQDIMEWNTVRVRVRRIIQAAADANQAVLVDAEESWIQDAIDGLVHELILKYNRVKPLVYQTVQLYRHDRLEYLKKTYAQISAEGCHFAVKLVRGAYMEKERERAAERNYPSPIQPDKASTDRDFDEAVRFCLEHIEQMALCCGSHNEESNLRMINRMRELGIEASNPRVWSAQLKGMSDHISFNLAHAGYRVAKYLPYGPVQAVLPYLVRRARENTSIAGQMSRELTLLSAERKRRRTDN
ncbi:MAG: proline dehydrogenase [Sphingomonadales bacterium]|nr:proline dehydrogenase [Sphingomonadales bacterium]